MTNSQDQYKKIKLQYHMVEKGDLLELGCTAEELVEGFSTSDDYPKKLHLNGSSSKGQVTGFIRDAKDQLVGVEVNYKYGSDQKRPFITKETELVIATWAGGGGLGFCTNYADSVLDVYFNLYSPIIKMDVPMNVAVLRANFHTKTKKGRYSTASFINGNIFQNDQGFSIAETWYSWFTFFDKAKLELAKKSQEKFQAQNPKRLPFEDPQIDHQKIQRDLMVKLIKKENPNTFSGVSLPKKIGFLVDYLIKHGNFPLVKDSDQLINDENFAHLLLNPKIPRKYKNYRAEWWICLNWLNIRSLSLEEIATKLESEAGISSTPHSVEGILKKLKLPRAVEQGRPEKQQFDDS
jgi:hypothetical protein